MQIARVEATLHRVPVEVPLLAPREVGVVVVRTETDDGLVGYGVAGVGFQASQWTLADTLYTDPPVAVDGVLTLSEAPGLGLEPPPDVLRETRVAAT